MYKMNYSIRHFLNHLIAISIIIDIVILTEDSLMIPVLIGTVLLIAF